jgi:F-type H+-transporting ATPase subunit delta
MTAALIAARYAKALSAAIANDAELDANLDALDTLAGLVAESNELRVMLNDPSIRIGVRRQVLRTILDKIEAPTPAGNAALVMLRRGRFRLLARMVYHFRKRTDERCNRVAARVTTAVSLSDEQLEPLRNGLESYIGRDVRMDRKVDESILGGVVAELNGIIIDGSVRSRLNRLSRALIEDEKALKN